MGALSYFKKIYDPDTLDTRFTNPSSVPYKTVIEARDDPAAASKERAARWSDRTTTTTTPSLWRTPEFFLWGLILYSAIPGMFWVSYNASNGRPEPIIFL